MSKKQVLFYRFCRQLILTIILYFAFVVIFSHLFISKSKTTFDHTHILDYVKESTNWQLDEFHSIYSSTPWPIRTKFLKEHAPFLVFFFTSVIVGVTMLRYLLNVSEMKMESVFTYPLVINGKQVPGARTVNPNGKPYVSPHPEIRTVADMYRSAYQNSINNKLVFLDEAETYPTFGRYLYKLTKLLCEYVPYNEKFLLYGEFNKATCAALIGACSMGRTAVFSSSNDTINQFIYALQQSHATCIMLKRSHFHDLVDALRFCPDFHLRTILYTDNDDDVIADTDNDYVEAEDVLSTEFGLNLVNVCLAMEQVDTSTMLLDLPKEDLSNQNAIIFFFHAKKICLTHHNIVTTCLSFIQQFQFKPTDTLVLEHKSYVNSISLFLSCLYVGMNIIECNADHVIDACQHYNPTFLSASQQTLINISKQIPPFTVLMQFKIYLKKLFSPFFHFLPCSCIRCPGYMNLGTHLKAIFSFYVNTPIPPHIIYTLLYGINCSVYVIYAPREAGGPATISINRHIFMKHGYISVPFPAIYIRINENNVLEIAGDSITCDTETTDEYGLYWFNTGIHASFSPSGSIMQMNRPYSDDYMD